MIYNRDDMQVIKEINIPNNQMDNEDENPEFSVTKQNFLQASDSKKIESRRGRRSEC